MRNLPRKDAFHFKPIIVVGIFCLLLASCTELSPGDTFGGNNHVTDYPWAKEYFEGVWGSSQNNVFAVGTNGYILHYNGSDWRESPGNVTARLTDVWGSSWDNVYAVGEAGTIIHYKGNKWTKLEAGFSQNLNALWGTSA
ncbi:MAG: hypothetical protein ACNS64_11925, partial [Candidatus Halalkalibacterium sp. M3_1C_030]